MICHSTTVSWFFIITQCFSLKQINQESESQTQNQESGNQEEGRTELKIHEKPDIPILSETDERRRLGETSKAANDEEVQKLQERDEHSPNDLQGDEEQGDDLPKGEEQRDVLQGNELKVEEEQGVELLLNEVYSPPAAPPQQELPVEGLISRTIWDWKTE